MVSGDPIVDTLVRNAGRLWNTAAGDIVGSPATVTYSFMARRPDYWAVATFEAFSDAMKDAARAIFAQYESVSLLRFVEVDDAGDGGQIRLGMGSHAAGLGYAHYPGTAPSGGDVWLSDRPLAFSDPSPGTNAYQIMMHEIGHAIGLWHPGNYNAQGAAPTPPYLSPELDTYDNTVMSYSMGADGWPTEPQEFDALALQYAYGMLAPGTIGNLTYGSELGETLLGTPDIDYMHGQGGDDAIALDAGDDGARGNLGRDTLIGGQGSDTLQGNEGADLILGGDDDDRIDGGEGDDDGNGNIGRDTVLGGAGADFARGGQDGDLIDGGDGDDWHVNGNLGDDLVYGGAGDDALFGGAGNDTLAGEWGRDRLSGDRGDDLLVADRDGDAFVFASGQGQDVIQGFTAGGARIEIAIAINGTDIASFATLVGHTVDIQYDDAASTFIELGDGNALILAGVSRAELRADDFLFV